MTHYRVYDGQRFLYHDYTKAAAIEAASSLARNTQRETQVWQDSGHGLVLDTVCHPSANSWRILPPGVSSIEINT